MGNKQFKKIRRVLRQNGQMSVKHSAHSMIEVDIGFKSVPAEEEVQTLLHKGTDPILDPDQYRTETVLVDQKVRVYRTEAQGERKLYRDFKKSLI